MSHGRTGIASILEAFQYIPNLFVPSYWFTDNVLLNHDLTFFYNYQGRYSAQAKFPKEIDQMEVGLINHNFPITKKNIIQIRDRLNLFLEPDAKIFIYDRNYNENLSSSYLAYLCTWFCYEHSNGKLARPELYKTNKPLDKKSFCKLYSIIADVDLQISLYQNTAFKVIRKNFNNLIDLDSEIKNLLNECDINFSKEISIPKIEYNKNDHWPIQTSFAFHNRFIIDGQQLNVGYFDPHRHYPNQGTLTFEISKNIYVAPDQWFLLPERYKEVIFCMNDPWRVIEKTKENYILYKNKVLNSLEIFL